MPLVSADAEASAFSGFVALLPVGDKPVDMTGGTDRAVLMLPQGTSGAELAWGSF